MLTALVRLSFALTLLMLASVGNVVLSTHADAAQVRLADVHYEQGGVLRGFYTEVALSMDVFATTGSWSWKLVVDHAGGTFPLADRTTFAAANASLTSGIDDFVELTSGMGPNTQFQDHRESELISNSSFFAPPNGIDYAGSTITALSWHVDQLSIDHVCVEVPFFSCDSAWSVSNTISIFGTRPVPEPSTFGLVTFGLILLGLSAWRRRRRTK